MTEEVKDVSPEEAPEPQAAPLPEMPSKASPEESSEQPAPDVSAVVEAAVERALAGLNIDDKIDARFKSAKDRRYAKVEEIYKWVQDAGGDVNRIKQDLEISDLREQISSMRSTPAEAVGSSEPLDSDWSVAQAKTDIILRRAGIASDDPEYNLLVSQYSGNIRPDDWPGVVETFAKGRRGGSPAQVVAESGGTAPVSADVDELSIRLVEATQKGASNEEIQKLQDQLRKAIES